MSITIEIGNVKSQILGYLSDTVLGKINARLSYDLPGAEFAMRYNPFAGKKYLFSTKTQTFPTGLLHYVEEVLTAENVSYEVLDRRTPAILGPPLTVHGFTPHPYQHDATIKAIAKQRGIIKIGTGGGKTNVLINIIAHLNTPTLVLIHKTDVFWQIIQRLEKALKMPIGKIGDSECDIQRITVGMIQSVSPAFDIGKKQKLANGRILTVPDKPEIAERKKKVREFVESCVCIITDECHHVPAATFLDVHKKAKNGFFKLGFSASPWREDNADMLIEAYHAKQIVDIPASWLIDNGYLVPPLVYRYKYRHPRKARGEQDYPEVYDEEVVNNVERNKIIVESALKASSQGKTVLIAITKVEHGRILEAMLQSVDPDALFVFGESESETRKTVLNELNERKRKIVVCTTIFGEGIDVPNLDVLINAKASKSSVDAFQLIGRVLRRSSEKQKAYVVDIADESCKYLGSHTTARFDIYATEHRYTIKDVGTVSELSFDDKGW